ncbi:RHS repeat-associated core domain-containing protein, partial [Aquimarina sp. RZ0]|uniref:RHS repeat-associated core domain-containing protein n=1 Tax=Aquimarina sp. RZ0 TaxID=2607730 RepID=UPI00165FDD2F
YETIGGIGTTLKFFHHPEGYAEPKNANDLSQGYEYVYQYKDHLGNIRLSYSDKDGDGKVDVLRGTTDIDGDGDQAMEVLEEKNYYPFGLQHKGYNNTITGREHNYGIGGKEEQDELGLNWHDFGARNYDAALGRWMNIDPLAEQYNSLSPYNYTMNNPIFFIDPDGQEVIIHFDKKHNKLYIYDDDNWDSNRETRAVTADEYKFSFGDDEESYNQILVIDDVFSGGKFNVKTGEFEHNGNKNEKEIPNGEFDLLDNEASTTNPEWYRIDAQDNEPHNDRYDVEGETNASGNKRNGFRLHTGRTSWGCVTICKKEDDNRQKEWNVLERIIQNTSRTTVPEKRGRQGLNPFSTVKRFGTITVSGQNPNAQKKKN